MQETDLTIERFVELRNEYENPDGTGLIDNRQLEQDLINCAHYLARQKNNIEATYWLCQKYGHEGLYTGLDHEQFLEYLQRAVDQNHAPSMHLMAQYYCNFMWTVSLTQTNSHKALELLKRAVDQEYNPARLDYVLVLLSTKEEANIHQAEKQLRILMANGNIEAYSRFYQSFFFMDTGRYHGDHEKGFKVLEQAITNIDHQALKDHPKICSELYYYMALSYYEGVGCKQDQDKALKYMHLSDDIYDYGYAYFWMMNRGIQAVVKFESSQKTDDEKPYIFQTEEEREVSDQNKKPWKKEQSDELITKLDQNLTFVNFDKAKILTGKKLSLEDLEDVLAPVDKLIGLKNITDQLRELFYMVMADQRRIEKGVETIQKQSLHMFFTGSPGTGKTMIAREVGKALKKLGVLSSGHLYEVDRADLVGPYIGQTEEKVKALLNQVKGGVLFIDEAYELDHGYDWDFGNIALSMLIKEMEDHRDDLVIIMAGYPEKMQRLLKSNPGLESRISMQIEFSDYSDHEKAEIFEYFSNEAGFKLRKDTKEKIWSVLKNMDGNAKNNMGNARGVRNLFEQSLRRQSVRVIKEDITHKTQLMTLTPDDIPGDWLPPYKTDGNILKLGKKSKK